MGSAAEVFRRVSPGGARGLLFTCLLGFAGGGVAQVADQGAGQSGELPAISIIIDDLGNRRLDGLRAIELPGPVAYAVLPHTPYGSRLAGIAFQLDKEVLLHVPMASSQGKALGPGGLTRGMAQMEIQAVLDAGLASVPHVIGLNNHMGSALTRNPRVMEWVMDWVKRNGGLYFVDSLTTSRSVALHSARVAGLPAIGRDVFLDAAADTRLIHKQFLRLIEIARDRGTGLGIGHPYPETLSVLRNVLLKPSYYGVELVSVEELIARRRRQASAEPGDETPLGGGRSRYAANALPGDPR
jgi:polysaccharide deacetylase 2 family uncharacterized protein YibQ